MTLRSLLDSPCGLRWCIDELPLASSAARRRLLDRELMTDPWLIAKAYADAGRYREALDRAGRGWPERMHAKLCTVKDLAGTMARLEAGQTLEDSELFECKLLVMLAGETGELHREAGLDFDIPCEADDILRLLDPDGTGVAAFHIYDSYSPELAVMRRRIRNLPEGEERSEALAASMEEELRVRERLSALLRPNVPAMREMTAMLCDADLNLAKALLMKTADRTVPEFASDGRISLEDFRHPAVEARLREQGRAYQPVSLTYGDRPVLLIGSNMGGKTVVLKSLALCQYLFQAAVPLPVKSARMRLFSSVYLCQGDGQDLEEGLSSFSAEMLRIGEALQAVRRGENALVLIDEPARSTNPVEGTALVEALLQVLGKLCPALVMTTHYNLRCEGVRRLKVRGMTDGRMDYTLCEAPYGEVPQEALRIAAHLGVDAEWIGRAREILNVNTDTERQI